MPFKKRPSVKCNSSLNWGKGYITDLRSKIFGSIPIGPIGYPPFPVRNRLEAEYLIFFLFSINFLFFHEDHRGGYRPQG